ncbi:DUF7282 domain-containing protein [Haloarcula laminariae]|uniref:DUF7282 domain-containing protein n=1 Tax=Haloarcula laminariae TaxID=2961577 RepID=UPI0024071210|nr:hypothetical protein [Halomicroarcula sp. FL173]
MLNKRQSVPILLAVVLVATVAVGTVLAQQQSVTVDATPSGPSEAESTHAVTFSVGDSAVAGAAWDDVRIDYSVDAPSADVSNVGASSIERVGIDRNDDAPGSQVDVRAETISEVTGQADGNALQIALGGALTLRQGDELVVVIGPVQNPQNAGTADVEVTVNTQAAAVSRTGSVTYEQHDASTTLTDQQSAGDTVVVDRVNLSEGGFVAVQNTTGATPGAVRGTSAYLEPGVHEDVEVTLDTPLDGTQDLVAQPYTDSNADRDFDYSSSGGEVDGPYRNGDDNVIGSSTATVTYDPDATATETATDDGTTGGSTDDGTTDSGTDDGTSSGSTDDGTTDSGTDDSTSGGSTDDGTNDGTTTDSGTDDGTNGGTATDSADDSATATGSSDGSTTAASTAGTSQPSATDAGGVPSASSIGGVSVLLIAAALLALLGAAATYLAPSD